MTFKANTLDDILNLVFNHLITNGREIKTSRGLVLEEIGVMIKIKNPRSRVSITETRGKIMSALGELLWYFSKENKLEFIEYYIPQYKKESQDKLTIYGGYGKRIFNFREGINQFDNVINLLKSNPNTRRAVIQIFDSEDINTQHLEVPCTCTMQFFVRDNKLEMITHMRSNDALFGLLHDVFSFTMIQEIIACYLNIEIGEYHHSVGNLHIYKNKIPNITNYLKEGFQSTKFFMPNMPKEDIENSIKALMEYENKIRKGEEIDIEKIDLNEYWIDIILILLIYNEKKKTTHNQDKLNQYFSLLKNKVYKKILIQYNKSD